ncbi:MAG: alkaline phosphatase family protein, partial [Gemmatimonadetes bacterium]|nr:alkaline phosphatase family protein [Gemmatimonadota bacterium]
MRRLLAFLLLATACSSGGPPATRPGPSDPPVIILVSIDGFRPDYLGRGVTPTLDSLARVGVRAEWMEPSFPSKTFPNHYTIVTGLRPDHHGIIANNIRDSVLGSFSMSNRAAVQEARWWGGEPVWVA